MKHRDRISLFERLVCACPGRDGLRSELKPDTCWLWHGSRCNKGYGHIRVAGKTMRVHIAAWELVKGRKVRRGYTLDHGCRNPACWRPSHMEEVTRAVNTARGNRANPRSTEKARAAKRRQAIPDWLRNDPDCEAAAHAIFGTVNPVTPSPEGGG